MGLAERSHEGLSGGIHKIFQRESHRSRTRERPREDGEQHPNNGPSATILISDQHRQGTAVATRMSADVARIVTYFSCVSTATTVAIATASWPNGVDFSPVLWHVRFLPYLWRLGTMKKIALSLLVGTAALGFVSSSFAADLIIEQPLPEVGIVDVGGNWDGLYVGAFVGGGWASADHANAVAPSPCAPDGCDIDLSGWLVGVTAGANFTVGSGFVLGVAGDIAWSDVSGSETTPFDFDTTVDWEGSLRAVAGFDGGAFMPYVTAGVAFAHATHSASPFGPPATEASATHVGATVGVGVMFAVADNLSLDLQYRHSWYDEQEYDMGLGVNNPIFALQTDRITAGLNLSF